MPHAQAYLFSPFQPRIGDSQKPAAQAFTGMVDAMTVTILHGDCLDVLRRLPSDSIDCCVTSPPYWGLRDYGVQGQMGLENSLAEHILVMVDVFEQVRRVLKPAGTLWVNYGDCYACAPNGRKADKITGDDRTHRDKPFSTVGAIDRGRQIPRGSGRWGGGNNPATGTLKPKDLLMIPNRLAIALQDAGWWVRAENIWGKTNPKPESVRDRPGQAHEKIFLFTKSAKSYYDRDAVQVALKPKTYTTYGTRRQDKGTDGVGRVASSRMARTMPERRPRAADPRHHNTAWNHQTLDAVPRGGRFIRNYEPAEIGVFPMATRPFKGAHFATFPVELAARCIALGCPPGGIVLDPFGGAASTAVAAERLGRDSVMIELNNSYIDIATNRLREDVPGVTIERGI
jgi:DNA modification methylase